MTYIGYVVRRIGQVPPTILGLTVIIFILTRALPGNPVQLALGPNATPEQVAQLAHIWGLDQPLYIQYFNFLGGLIHGSLGVSLASRRDVVLDIQEFLPATIELATAAVIFAVIVAIPLGVISARKKDKWQDHGSRLLALGGVSLPDFWTAIMLLVIFGSILRVLPIAGRLSPNLIPPPWRTGSILIDSVLAGNLTDFVNGFEHLILPAFVLSLPMIANFARVTRSMMIDQMQKDYVLMENASGLPSFLVTYKYMLKNAFAPTLTLIALQYAFAFGGAVVVEYVYAWPGVGRYMAYAILNKDINAIAGVTLVVGTIIASANTIADLAYGWLDPRIRFREVI
jgi:peptide/nickel transport system permease protein